MSFSLQGLKLHILQKRLSRKVDLTSESAIRARQRDVRDYSQLMDLLIHERDVPIMSESRPYLLTLTRDPSVTKDYWFKRVCGVLSRKFVVSFQASLEHINENIHCHVYCHSSKYLRKRDFQKFPGFVKIDKITKDNGITDYISKENKIFTDIITLQEFYNGCSSS